LTCGFSALLNPRQSAVLFAIWVKMMEGKLTVYFDPPFWVGIFEKIEENQYLVARYVFGAEPTEAQMIQFGLSHFSKLNFSHPQRIVPVVDKPVNYKRRMRQVREQMRSPAGSTKAQQTIRQEYEMRSNLNKIEIREIKAEEEIKKYHASKARRAEKHCGH
jgi:hypothetical protein